MLFRIVTCQRNFNENFKDTTEPVDGLASVGAKPSTGMGMTQVIVSYLYRTTTQRVAHV